MFKYFLFLQANEKSFAESINKKIHEKHLYLDRDLEIPFIFIDPVVDIFEDPCDKTKTREVSTREKEQFQTYTDK